MMKKYLFAVILFFFATLLMGGLRTFGPDIYFQGLTHNGDASALVISGDRVYQQDLVGAYAYLNTGTITEIVTPNLRVPISGTFTNEVLNGFVGSGTNLIVYTGTPRIIRYIISRYGQTTSNTYVRVGVKHNGNIITGSNSIARAKNINEYMGMVSISQASMTSGDTIQLVITAGAGTSLIPDIITTYASPLF